MVNKMPTINLRIRILSGSNIDSRVLLGGGDERGHLFLDSASRGAPNDVIL